MSTFKAIVVDKAEAGQTVRLTDFDEKDLMDGDVTVRVEYSTVNYKDGLAVTGNAPVVRRFPMIAGRGFSPVPWNPHRIRAGRRATRSSSTAGVWAKPISAPTPGRRASRATGWCGCRSGISARDAMAIGTAGYTAMLAVMALERAGLDRRAAPWS